MHKPRVALGMSGGVDSSLSAHLLVEQGFDVTGVYLECWRAPGCRTEEDRKDALSVALQLQIPFQVLDFKDAYKQKVVEYFFNEYQKGRTPNPDVMCNKEVKFGLFYDWAIQNGFDYVATGHYSQIKNSHLITSVDTHKDQTYFLYLLNETQLPHILFPIGHLAKSEVRQQAQQRHIAVADKKDSVGICFIGDINVHQFLKDRLGENPGQVVDIKGNVVGQHQGLWFYTIGQRHGFTIQPKSMVPQSDGTQIDKHNIPPFYVINKIPEKNQLVVGFGAEAFQKELQVNDIHWIHSRPNNFTDSNFFVRIRHTGELYSCKIVKDTASFLVIQLDAPIQGIASGQSAVFYQHSGNLSEFTCLGGGIIEQF